MREHGDRFEHAEQARGRSPACSSGFTVRFLCPPRVNLILGISPETNRRPPILCFRGRKPLPQKIGYLVVPVEHPEDAGLLLGAVEYPVQVLPE